MSDLLECHKHPRALVDKSLNSKTLRFSVWDVQSRMLIDRPNDLVLAYTRLMMGFLLFSPDPRHLAMIGLGGGSLAKFCYRHLPDTRIQVLEINPYVIALRNEFEVPADDHRFSIRKEDAADYIRTAPYRFDVIMADGFDANQIPLNLCSQSFYDNCREKLEPNGVLVANLHAGHEHFPTHLERIRKSFAGQVIAVSDLEDNNVIAFAFKEIAPLALLPNNLNHCASTLAPEAWRQLEPSFFRIKKFGRQHGESGSRSAR
ncbi:fused MFS/spermidine synthase [Variovorax paradoxus]|uniref:Spermidine synthase n=1 Tax=Variovorax paradoxus TaxID=34073 RepID=A0A0H2LS24_VARPD|nr:fused MFS/spermidine synthase [Variovorax paradoxus]KLN53088.1 spermidine synthase [Variovorax paradoxus]